MASLGALVIELAANTARLQGDMGKAVNIVQGAVGKFNVLFRGLGALGAGASFVQLVSHSIELGDNLNKAAIKAGVTGRAMSELAYAAKLSDIDLSSLSTALKKMQVSLSQAASGAKAPQEALAALGLSIKDIKNLAPDKQFELLGDRISRIADPADRARAAVELFGKAGADLLPLFSEGAEGIRKAREEAVKLGASFSDEQIKALAAADDSVKQLKASWEGFATALTVKVTPVLRGILGLLHGELPKASLESQIANIQYQISALEGTKVDRGIKKLAELRTQLILLNEQLNPYDDFAARQSRSRAGSQVAPGFKPETDNAETITEVIVTAQRVHAQTLAQMYADTQTYAEREIREYEHQINSINQLKEEGVITAEEALRRLAETQEEYDKRQLGEVQVLVQRVGQTTEKMSEYAIQAARNMQTAFANFLFDPFKDGLKGMLKGFIDTIRRMADEAAAAQIFGSKASGGFGLGSAITGVVSGAIGGAISGKPSVSQSINIDARGSSVESVKLMQATIPSIIKSAVDQSRAAVRDDISRYGRGYFA